MDNTQLDCFRFCRFLKLLGNIMILMVLALVGVSYFAVAYTYTGDIKHASPGAAVGGILVLAVFTAVIIMLCWSYFAVVLSNPGSVPPGWHPFASDEDAAAERERIASGIAPMASVDPLNRPRFCRKCQAWKPQRAHHCSISNKCILKMDHYCIWVVNCVGLLNYKFFLLFLFYTLVASFLGAALLMGEFIKFFNLDSQGRALSEAGPMVAVVFIAFVIDIAFTVCLMAFVLMHWNMVSKNQTTIELYEKTPISPWPYDKGSAENLREVFGREPFFWLLPMHTRRHRDDVLHSTLYPYLSGSPETPLTASYRTEQQSLGAASERYLAQPIASFADPSHTNSADGLV